MAQLILELDREQEAELARLAMLLQQSPVQVAHAALAAFIANHAERFSNAVTTEPSKAGNLPDADTAATPHTFKHDHSAFGMLKGMLELDGAPVADGVEYQNRIRSAW